MLFAAMAHAQGGYILGLNAEFDTADGRAAGAFADYGFGDRTWLSVALARTNTGGPTGGLETLYADAAIEQAFGAFGVRAGAAYWGDDEILDSNDARASVFYRGDRASLTLDYEKRKFDFIVNSLDGTDQRREVEFSANGVGAAAWLTASDRIGIFASGMRYDYSRDIRLTDNIGVLRFLSTSRLSLMNSLVDYRFNVGMDIRFGSSILDLSFGQWQTAIDGGKVESIMLGYVVASGPATDLEFRLAFDDSDNFGSTIALAVGFYFFGA